MEVAQIVVSHPNALLDEVGSVAVELLLEPVVLLLSLLLDAVDPSLIFREQASMLLDGLIHDLPVECRVVRLLDFLESDARRLQLQVLRALGNEDSAEDLGVARVVAQVAFQIKVLVGKGRWGWASICRSGG